MIFQTLLTKFLVDAAPGMTFRHTWRKVMFPLDLEKVVAQVCQNLVACLSLAHHGHLLPEVTHD